MKLEVLRDFRLVGGTALSLQLGHRLSVDIDLFTDVSYGSIDFPVIEQTLQQTFNYNEGDFGANPGFGKSYLVGSDVHNMIKLDLYYTTEPFFQNALIEDSIRMATIDEIVAMKIDITKRYEKKKTFGIYMNC